MHFSGWLMATIVLNASFTLSNPIGPLVDCERGNLLRRSGPTITATKTTSTSRSSTKTTSTTKKTTGITLTTTSTSQKTISSTRTAPTSSAGNTGRTTTPTKTGVKTSPPTSSPSGSCNPDCYLGGLSQYCDSAVFDPGEIVGSARWATATDCQHDSFERWRAFQWSFFPNKPAGTDNCVFYSRNGSKLSRYSRTPGVTSGGFDCGGNAANYGGYP